MGPVEKGIMQQSTVNVSKMVCRGGNDVKQSPSGDNTYRWWPASCGVVVTWGR